MILREKVLPLDLKAQNRHDGINISFNRKQYFPPFSSKQPDCYSHGLRNYVIAQRELEDGHVCVGV